MSETMTPRDLLSSYVEKFNAGDLNSVIGMYETDACFVSQLGQVVSGLENIQKSLQGFINMHGNLETEVKEVIKTSDIALVNTEWSFDGTGPDGKPVNITGKATDILRQQADGTWRILIDNPWGANLSQ